MGWGRHLRYLTLLSVLLSASVAATPTSAADHVIGGVAFSDRNGNGVRDVGEPGLNQVYLSLVGSDSGGGEVNRLVWTGGDGVYAFTSLPASNAQGYTLTVMVTTGGFVTPAPRAVVVPPSATSLDIAITPPIVYTSRDWYRIDANQSLDVSASQGVLANDRNFASGPYTAVLETGPGRAASFVFRSDGSFVYIPPANYAGTDTFTYRAHGPYSVSALTTVEVGVMPVVAAITPATGPTSGGNRVTITGAGFGGSSLNSVQLHGNIAVVESVTPTSIVFLAPPHAPGSVYVFVTTSGFGITVANGYTYSDTVPNALPVARPAGGASMGGPVPAPPMPAPPRR